jgi:hypothetical protein
MKRLWLIPVVFCIVLVPTAIVLASNGGNGFDSVVNSIQSRYRVQATRIPFMGLVSLISRKATHGGVSGMHVAGWERMIRETSRSGKEQTLIFVRPEGSRIGMFIVDKDGNEMDVVQISVDPDHLNDSIGQYEHAHPDRDPAHPGYDKGSGVSN